MDENKLDAVEAQMQSAEIPQALLDSLFKHCCKNPAWIRHAWREYTGKIATPPASASTKASEPVTRSPQLESELLMNDPAYRAKFDKASEDALYAARYLRLREYASEGYPSSEGSSCKGAYLVITGYEDLYPMSDAQKDAAIDAEHTKGQP